MSTSETSPTSSDYIHDPNSLENKNFAITLRHKKCGLVRKIKEQMGNAEEKYGFFTHCYGCCRNKMYGCWGKSVCCISIIIAVLALSWACLIYGTVIGATACSRKGNKPYLPLFQIPGLKWQDNNDKLWKVF